MSADRESVVLVTGGSGGIGQAVAARLTGEGCAVVLAARDAGRLEEAADRIQGLGLPRPLTLSCDVTDPESVTGMVAAVLAEKGRIDVLVNAAGLNRPGLFLRMSPQDWEEVLRVNLTGVMRTTQAVLGCMRKQRGGTVITIASLGGKQGRKGMAAYCASKFGVVGLMDTIRQEAGRLGVRVTTILPGEVDTAMHGDSAEHGGRRIPPEDVAEAVMLALRLSDRTEIPEIELHNHDLD